MNKKKWAYVSTFGALWGVIEITLGSFLHVLRIPFTGTFLASVTASLLVAQRQFISFRGISIYTGIVAMLIKSLSPDGIILGPMVGILSEAMLVELILTIKPQSIITAILSGIICSIWATLQGIVHQWIIYGTSILKLYLKLLYKATNTLGLPVSYGIYALIIFFTLIAAIAATISLIGYYIALQSRKELIKKGILTSNSL